MQIEQYGHSTIVNGQQPQLIPLNYYSTTEEKDNLSLKQVLSVFQRRIWVIAGVALAVTGSIWAWTLTRTPIYQAGFQILVEPITNINRPQEQVVLFGYQSNFDYATQIEVLRSPELLAPIVQKLRGAYPDISYEEIVGKMAIGQMSDSQDRLTKILSVSYRDPDPQRVKAVLDALASGFLAYSVQLRQTSLQQGVKFVEDQLPELRSRVNQLQAQMETFRQRYSILDPEVRGSELSRLLSEIEKQRQDTQTELAGQRSLYDMLERQMGYRPGEALIASALSEAPRYQSLLNQIQQVESQIANESARFQADSPNIQLLLEKRRNLLPLLEQESRRILGNQAGSRTNANLTPISLELTRQLVNAANQVKVLEMRNQALVNAESNLKRQFSLVPSLARQYTDLERELKVATESLNRFLASREDLQIEAAQRAIPWQLILAAKLPTAPVSPNVPRNLALGVFAGLLLGVGAALMAEKLDNVFHSAADLKDTTRLPLLGIIPYHKKLKELAPTPFRIGLPQAATVEVNLPTVHEPGEAAAPQERSKPWTTEASPFLDAFRSLYTNIRFLGSDTPIRSLVVGSAVPGDGKSTVASHLAQVAASMGQRVLLVDADLRRPQISNVLGLPNLRGLSNVISTDIDPTTVMQQSPTEENLWVLTAGQIPPDPTKLLCSKKMQTLTEQFKSMFDLVIYDTPPLLGLADSCLLGAHTDGLILVVGLGRTDRSALMQALDGIKLSSTTVLGIVANGVKNQLTSDYYYSYHQRYYENVPQVDEVEVSSES